MKKLVNEFVSAHLQNWVPRFAEDMGQAA